MFYFQIKILLLSILILIICKYSIAQFNTVPSIRNEKVPFPAEKVRKTLVMPAMDSVADKEIVASMPLKEIEFTSSFGWRVHPIEKVVKHHEGVDLKAYYEPVFAFGDGWVARTGWDKSSGKYIVLGHGDGKLESTYAHLGAIWVRPGEAVESGQIIAISGNSGRSTAPHLHFGLQWNGESLDPGPVLEVLVARQKTH